MATQNEYRFDLPLKDERELRLFVLKAFGVRIPDVQVCPEHTSPWRAFADAYFARNRMAVWKASRGFGGKTFTLGLLGLTEACTLKADVKVLGGSGQQSQRVHAHTQAFWNHRNAPRQLLASDPTKMQTRLRWGNSIEALVASQASTRGPHPQRLRMDEIDEMDLSVLDAAMGETMSRNQIPAQTVMSSTHQHSDGTMTEVLKRANERGWPLYEWCYRETMEPHGWLAEREIEGKRDEVSSVMWQVEYELQEPSPESRAIDPSAVRAMFDRRLGHWRGADNEYVQAEQPVEGAEYVTGADWARKKDWTVIVTLRTDVKPARVVAFRRMRRRPWPVMTKEYDRRLEDYGERGAHDATGLGDVVDGFLEHRAEPILMVGRGRSDMLSEYIAAVERGDVVSPYIEFMEAEHRLASVDDVYGTGSTSHLPDSIAAMAVAWKIASIRTDVDYAESPFDPLGGMSTDLDMPHKAKASVHDPDNPHHRRWAQRNFCPECAKEYEENAAEPVLSPFGRL